MKKLITTGIIGFSIILFLAGCRPKDLEGAFVHYNASRYDQALELAEKVTKEHPTNSEAFYLLGVLYGKKDRIAEMVNSFDKSLEIDQTHKQKIETEKQNYFANKFNSAATLYNKYLKQEDRNSDAAVKILMRAVNNFKDVNIIKTDYRAINLMAQGFSLLGKDEESLESYTQLTSTFPDSGKAWMALGKFYYEKKDYENAAQSFQKSTEIDDKNSEALTYLAQTYDFMQLPEKAIPAYKKAIEANENDSAITFNLGLLLYKAAIEKGVPAEEKNKKLAMAVEFFAKSIEINPDFKSSYQLKGNAELLTEKYEDAKNTLKEGVDMFPDDEQMWEDLAITYSHLGDKEKAEAADKRAKELNN